MKIIRNLDFEPGHPGPIDEIIGIQCDVCGDRHDADKRTHTPRIDLDDGHTIHRVDLCSPCLSGVRQALGEIVTKMRPVTEWLDSGIRSWGYDQIDAETGTICRSSSICDEGLWSRFS